MISLAVRIQFSCGPCNEQLNVFWLSSYKAPDCFYSDRSTRDRFPMCVCTAGPEGHYYSSFCFRALGSSCRLASSWQPTTLALHMHKLLDQTSDLTPVRGGRRRGLGGVPRQESCCSPSYCMLGAAPSVGKALLRCWLYDRHGHHSRD